MDGALNIILCFTHDFHDKEVMTLDVTLRPLTVVLNCTQLEVYVKKPVQLEQIERVNFKNPGRRKHKKAAVTCLSHSRELFILMLEGLSANGGGGSTPDS